MTSRPQPTPPARLSQGTWDEYSDLICGSDQWWDQSSYITAQTSTGDEFMTDADADAMMTDEDRAAADARHEEFIRNEAARVAKRDADWGGF